MKQLMLFATVTVLCVFGIAVQSGASQTHNISQNMTQNLVSNPVLNVEEDTHKVTITGIIDRQELVAGDTIFVALTQHIAEGWHTYWRNPGDSGAAPIVEWDVPANTILGNLLWPVPQKLPYGPLTNYGYENEATLLQAITFPDPLPQMPFDITANIDILVCKEICIPEYHEVIITVTGDTSQDIEHFGFVGDVLNKMPTSVSWHADYQEYHEGETSYLAIDLDFQFPALIASQNNSVSFEVFPYDWGLVDNSSPTRIKLSDDKKTLRLFRLRGERSLAHLDRQKFLIAYQTDTEDYGALAIEAIPDPDWKAEVLAGGSAGDKAAAISDSVDSVAAVDAADTAIGLPAVGAALPQTGLPKALWLAFLGGMILNLMPCVFPVLSLKALHLTKMGTEARGAARLSGVAYAAGILLSFAVLAGLLIVLKQAGSGIGWGFHLQNPLVVMGLAMVLFVFAMNLSGFFEIGGRFTAAGGKLAAMDGAKGSFFTGVLAAVVATPCTAPFMGVAIGYALLQGAGTAFMVFLMLGLGLAAPYLLLSFVPALRGFMPKPGIWMQRFKEFLAFPLYASAAWLVWVYSQQSDAAGLLYALILMVAAAMLVWVVRVTPILWPRVVMVIIVVILAVLTARHGGLGEGAGSYDTAAVTGGISAPIAYTPAALEQALATKRPVFVNMTAAWCITCKVNEKIALDTEATRALFSDKNILYVKGDWTNMNAEIAAFLARYGRSGVPLYVYYGAADGITGDRPEPVILPQILTPDIVRNHVM